MELQNARQRFESQGLQLAAISYDSPAILKDFADRHKIEFSLLADPHSEVIRSFNVLNAEAKGMTKGMAYPGFFYIDSSGVVREKYFEAKYTNRFTGNNVIEKLFPELTEEVSQTVDLEAIKEQVPVFEGKFRITQDVTVSASKTGDGIRALLSASKTISITGELQYQACDKTICYPPTSVPVKWELQVQPLDLKRAPKAIQHK